MEYLIQLIQTVGHWGYGVLFLIIFFESFPLTFFLPGDSLLFTTGILASSGHFNIFILVPTLFMASIFGYILSYLAGEWLRDIILKSNDRYWFKKKHLDYTEDFYKRYGAKTLIIGRFVPIVRSFAPTLAGAVRMEFKKFLRYAILGGAFWTIGITTIGFYFGKIFPATKIHLTPIILAIVFVSLLPAIIEYIRSKRRKNTQPE
jgi:membrane-associated protein